jgi:hypothetical protein
MLASLAWGQRMPMQEGAQWETQRLVTSKASTLAIVQTFQTGVDCFYTDKHLFTPYRGCHYYGERYNPEIHDVQASQECEDFGNSILPNWGNRRGLKCIYTPYFDKNRDHMPQINELYEYWSLLPKNYNWIYEMLHFQNIRLGGCACVVAHRPYIDGAGKNDILFYPIGGLDWENADGIEKQKYGVASAFFKKLWPQYGDNNPYHVSYCYESLSFSEHNNPYLASERVESNSRGTQLYNGDICIAVFDNRAVLDMFKWDMGCDSKCTRVNLGPFGNVPWFGEKDDCCCELNWLYQQDPTINVAHEMINMGGLYYSTLEPNMFFDEGVGIQLASSLNVDVTGGTGIRPEHNRSGVNGVWAYQTKHDVIDAGELQARRNHMAAIAGELDETDPDYDPDAPYDYNFGGYTNYVYQAGCSQTMGDTLRDVGQLTSCQGYNIRFLL